MTRPVFSYTIHVTRNLLAVITAKIMALEHVLFVPPWICHCVIRQRCCVKKHVVRLAHARHVRTYVNRPRGDQTQKTELLTLSELSE